MTRVKSFEWAKSHINYKNEEELKELYNQIYHLFKEEDEEKENDYPLDYYIHKDEYVTSSRTLRPRRNNS